MVEFIIDRLPDGVSYALTGKAGEPEIPALSIMIAVPEGAVNIAPFLQQTFSASLTNAFLLPKPDAKSERVYLPKSYQSLSHSELILSAPAKIRTMRIVSLTVPLVEFNSSNGSVKARKKFTCGITFDLGTQLASQPPKNNADPVFSQLYSKLAANTSDIERFRGGFHSHLVSQKLQAAAIPPTFDKSIINWIDPGAPYIKLVATRTGLYRVTAAEAGISTWKQSEVRMFNKGIEVPIWIDSSFDGRINAIEYFGERLAGFPGEYYNWDSDSNAYWLTNSPKFQTAPKRYTDKVITGNPPLTISEGNITLHHEQDNFYYGGDAVEDATATLHRSEWVPGERFVWQELPSRFNNSDVLNVFDTFMISSLPVNTAGMNAQITVFLRGISTMNGGSVTHKAILHHQWYITGCKFYRFQ